MLVDAHIPSVPLIQVLRATGDKENSLSLAEELARFLYEEMPEKSRDYAVALIARWYGRDGMELPRLPK